MITRHIQDKISSRLHKGKAIVVMGARQVGKTTLLKRLFEGNPYVLWFNGDEMDIQALFRRMG